MEEDKNGNETAQESRWEQRRRQKIEKELDIYHHMSLEEEREKFVKELVEEKYRLLGSIKAQAIKNERLRFTFNSNFIRGKNKYVSLDNADVILAYLIIRDIAKAEARNTNKGKATYEYLYRTNARRLSKQFGVAYSKARKLIDSMWAMGMWDLRAIERDKLYVFCLGERKRHKFGQSDSWVFSLNKGRARIFYQSEKKQRRLLLEQWEREKQERALDRGGRKRKQAKAL